MVWDYGTIFLVMERLFQALQQLSPILTKLKNISFKHEALPTNLETF
jgi:hypothetical protein